MWSLLESDRQRLINNDPTLTVLDADLRPFPKNNDGATKAFGAALATNEHLTRLHMSGCDIGDSEMVAIARGLRENTSIQVACFSWNAIESWGAIALGGLLKMNQSLKRLDVSGNDLGDGGAMALFDALRENQHLETLYLNSTGIGNGCSSTLANMLKVNTTLKSLFVNENKFDKEGAKLIAEMGLEYNVGLETLGFSGNNIQEEGAVALKNALQRKNKTITSLVVVTNETDREYDAVQKEINYYCNFNKMGRQFLGDVTIPWSLWPRILGRISHDPSLMFGFLTERPDLFKRDQYIQKGEGWGTQKEMSRDELSTVDAREA